MLLSNARAAAVRQRLFNIAFMMVHDQWTADDIAQEAMSRVLQHQHEFQDEAAFVPWSYAIVLNLCRNRARKKSPTFADDATLDLNRHPRHGPTTSIILRESYALAAAAVSNLPEDQREVFILHYIEGLPYSQVADICLISVGAARVRAMRARDSLKAELAMLEPDVRSRVLSEPPESTES